MEESMNTCIRRWGNSLALRIPKALADEIGVSEHSPVQLALHDGQLVIVPIKETAYTLEHLLGQVTDDNRHGEINHGPAIGGEVW